MHLFHSRHDRFIQSEASPTNDMDTTHFSIGADIDEHIDGPFGFSARGTRRILRPQTFEWPR